jgi:hypothetical protein
MSKPLDYYSPAPPPSRLPSPYKRFSTEYYALCLLLCMILYVYAILHHNIRYFFVWWGYLPPLTRFFPGSKRMVYLARLGRGDLRTVYCGLGQSSALSGAPSPMLAAWMAMDHFPVDDNPFSSLFERRNDPSICRRPSRYYRPLGAPPAMSTRPLSASWVFDEIP